MNWLDQTKVALIDVSAVDLEDATYLVPCWSPLVPLLRSVQAVGILNPPAVQTRPDGTLVPVLGRRRLAAARHLGISTVRAKVMASDMPEAQGFELAVWDNLATRMFDAATTAVVVKRLLELFSRREIADRFLPVLGVKPEGPRLERLRAIGRLEPALLEALGTGRVQEKTAVLLTRLLPAERAALLDLADQLRLNANKTAEVVSHVTDLAVRTGTRVSHILCDPRVTSMANNEERPVPDRAGDVRALLKEWKFPELTSREREFHRRLSEMVLPPKVSVRPTRSFEDEGCSIEISAESWDEVEKILRALSDIGEDSP